MLSSIRKHAMGSVCMRLSVLQPSARGMGTATLTSASKYADKREHPSPTVNVSGDGTITSTSELDSEQYNLLDAGPTACHSLLDPKYHAGSSAKAFAGWDPRSFGNSLGSSLRDPAYDVSARPHAPSAPPQRSTRRGS